MSGKSELPAAPPGASPAPVLVQDFLEHSAALRPDKVALVCGDRRITYRQLEDLANRLANGLRHAGVSRGDRVAIQLNNSVEAVVAIFATLKAGAVFVTIHRTVKAAKLKYILHNCRAAALITSPRAFADHGGGEWFHLIPTLRGAVLCGKPVRGRENPDPRCLDYDRIQAEFPATRPPRCNIDLDLACLIYTSGTTGEPKGVMSDHGNVVFASGSIIHYLGNVDTDVVLNVFPLSFDYGLYQVLMTFRVGGTLVLEDSFAFPAMMLQRIGTEKVTGFPGVPTVFAMLLQMDLSQHDLSSLRYLTNTAASLPPTHIQELRRKFPHVTIFSMYGLTETKRTLYLPPEWLDRKPGSVGVAIPGTEAWIEDDAGHRLESGQTGELVVRGRHVMRGYWEAPEATAARFRPGPIPGERLCYTGDLFRMDADGCFYFVGRKDDIIKSRGEKVAPREVENVLCALAGVAEVAVVGVPDPVLGSAIKAVIVRSDPQLTAAAVLAHCKANLEEFMVPRIVEFQDALARSPSGKIRKEQLV